MPRGFLQRAEAGRAALVLRAAAIERWRPGDAPHGFLRVGAACPRVRVADPDAKRRGDPAPGRARRAGRACRCSSSRSWASPATPRATCSSACTTLVGRRRAGARAPPRPRRAQSPMVIGGRPARAATTGGSSTARRCSSRAACWASCPRRTCPATRSTTRSGGSPRPARRTSDEVRLRGQDVPFGTDLLFTRRRTSRRSRSGSRSARTSGRRFRPAAATRWRARPCSSNLSASNELVAQGRVPPRAGEGAVRRAASAAYVYANNGVHESTTDVVFGGQLLIAENGDAPGGGRSASAARASWSSPTSTSSGCWSSACGRRRSPTRCTTCRERYRRVALRGDPAAQAAPPGARRSIPHPFVPARPGAARRALPGDLRDPDRRPRASGSSTRASRRSRSASPAGSTRRWRCSCASAPSTCSALPREGDPGGDHARLRHHRRARSRTRATLARGAGVDLREIDIRAACPQHIRDIGLDPGGPRERRPSRTCRRASARRS